MTQYCNHIKTHPLWQEADVVEADKNAFTQLAEAESAFNQGSRKRLPFLIYLITKNETHEKKFHELDPGKKTNQVSFRFNTRCQTIV